jgi:hypothetical protein
VFRQHWKQTDCFWSILDALVISNSVQRMGLYDEKQGWNCCGVCFFLFVLSGLRVGGWKSNFYDNWRSSQYQFLSFVRGRQRWSNCENWPCAILFNRLAYPSSWLKESDSLG